MSGHEQSNPVDDVAANANTQDGAEAEEAGSNRRNFTSFSMAHALSMVRKRQQEQQKTHQEQEANLDQVRKEKARAKRKRRRQNQKLAKAKAKTEGETEADDEEGEQSSRSDEETSDQTHAVADAANDGNGSDALTHGDATRTLEILPDQPPKKRVKLGESATNPKSSSVALASKGEAQNVADSLARASQAAIKLRSLVPRAVMLKKNS